jgi:hypothetical protein
LRHQFPGIGCGNGGISQGQSGVEESSAPKLAESRAIMTDVLGRDSDLSLMIAGGQKRRSRLLLLSLRLQHASWQKKTARKRPESREETPKEGIRRRIVACLQYAAPHQMQWAKALNSGKSAVADRSLRRRNISASHRRRRLIAASDALLPESRLGARPSKCPPHRTPFRLQFRIATIL